MKPEHGERNLFCLGNVFAVVVEKARVAGAGLAGLTAAYVLVRDDPVLRAALSGAGPAAAGMTAGLAFSFARQAVRRGWRGAVDYGYGAVVLGAGLLLGATPQVVIAAGVVVGVTLLRGEPSRASGDPGT